MINLEHYIDTKNKKLKPKRSKIKRQLKKFGNEY